MNSVILLHGALGVKTDLNALEEQLKKFGIKTHSFSFSGHGGNVFNHEFSIAQFSEELKDFILSHNLTKPHVFGYSMGGYAALYLASLQSGLFGNIITFATKFNWSKEVVEKETKPLNPQNLEQNVPRFVDALKDKHGENWPRLVEQTAQLMWDIYTKQYLNTENLAAINNKVLITVGDRDKLVTLEETVLVYRALKNASLSVIANTGHPIEKLNIDDMAKLIRDFCI